jgi:hypothetical protein
VRALARGGPGAGPPPVVATQGQAAKDLASGPLGDAVRATRPARAHPEWSHAPSLRDRLAGMSGERAAVVNEVAGSLAHALQAHDTARPTP